MLEVEFLWGIFKDSGTMELHPRNRTFSMLVWKMMENVSRFKASFGISGFGHFSGANFVQLWG